MQAVRTLFGDGLKRICMRAASRVLNVFLSLMFHCMYSFLRFRQRNCLLFGIRVYNIFKPPPAIGPRKGVYCFHRNSCSFFFFLLLSSSAQKSLRILNRLSSNFQGSFLINQGPPLALGSCIRQLHGLQHSESTLKPTIPVVGLKLSLEHRVGSLVRNVSS